MGYRLAGFQVENLSADASPAKDGRIVVDETGGLFAVCNGELIPCPEDHIRIRRLVLEDQEAGKKTTIDFGEAAGKE